MNEKIKELLKSKGIDMMECFDEVKTAVFNPSKLGYLVQIGKVTEEEVTAAIPALSPALKITPSKALKEAIESLGIKGKTLHEDSKALPAKK